MGFRTDPYGAGRSRSRAELFINGTAAAPPAPPPEPAEPGGAFYQRDNILPARQRPDGATAYISAPQAEGRGLKPTLVVLAVSG